MPNKPKRPTPAKIATAIYGSRGLDIPSGYIRADSDNKLEGERKRKIFAEMRDNSPVIGAVLYAIRALVARVAWRIDPVDPLNKDDVVAAEFCTENLFAEHVDFDTFIEQLLSMIVFGFSVHEFTLMRSSDGKLVLDSLGFRPQRTIWRWVTLPFDDNRIVGVEQWTPEGKVLITPLDKCIHLIAADFDGSPEGRSLLRSAYRPWYFAKALENNEAIRAERDAVGVPIARIPAECLAVDASPEKIAVKSAFEKIVANLRNDEQAGVVIPSDRDEKGHLLFDLSLLGVENGGTRIDISEPIRRYNTQILMTLLADFMTLGHEKVGSFALSSDKTNMFAQALGGMLRKIKLGVTRQLLQRLLRINNIPGECSLEHSDLEKLDLDILSQTIERLARTGMIFNDEQTEAHVRALLDLPERLPDEVDDANIGVNDQPTDDGDSGNNGDDGETSNNIGSDDDNDNK